jgi:DNA polymerase
MKDKIRDALDYYRELGFEELPFRAVPAKGRPASAAVQKAADPGAEPTPDDRVSSSPGPAVLVGASGKAEALKSLRDEIGSCTRCKLSRERTNIVFGEGSPDAELMFIGEAPGREEDAQGRPFVGEAGQHLTRLIEKLGFRRETVYIANVCKCRPPGNRDPEADEMSTCFPFLSGQIRIIAPKIIISLGKIATYRLMQPSTPIAKFSILKVRGQWFQYRDIPVMPTTHPAYWLRYREDKYQVLREAQEAVARLRMLKGES